MTNRKTSAQLIFLNNVTYLNPTFSPSNEQTCILKCADKHKHQIYRVSFKFYYINHARIALCLTKPSCTARMAQLVMMTQPLTKSVPQCDADVNKMMQNLVETRAVSTFCFSL